MATTWSEDGSKKETYNRDRGKVAWMPFSNRNTVEEIREDVEKGNNKNLKKINDARKEKDRQLRILLGN